MTVAEFSERFKKFHVGRAIIDHLATPPPVSEVATKGHSGQDEVHFVLRCPLVAKPTACILEPDPCESF